MKYLITLLFLLQTITVFSQNNHYDWKRDIAFIKEELPQKHYDFFHSKSKEEFYAGLDQISKDESQYSDFEVAAKLQQFLSTFGDSHTLLNLSPLLNIHAIYPLGIKWFSDGIRIYATTKSNEEILGAKIIKINNHPISEVVDSLSTFYAIDNESSVKKLVPNVLPIGDLLKYYKFSDENTLKLKLEKEGKVFTYKVEPALINNDNAIAVQPESVPLSNQNNHLFFWNQVIDENVLYIQYNQCISRENPPAGFKGNLQDLPSFNEFQTNLLNSLRNHEYGKVIFDVRYNGGGNSYQGTKLIEKLAKLENVNGKEKLYVIIGRDSYSSTILNILDFQRLTDAFLVGEPTSGKPNHLGEVRTMKLPSSGLSLNYSTKYFKKIEEDLDTITPDKTIELSFDDYKKGVDPVLDWILDLKNQ